MILASVSVTELWSGAWPAGLTMLGLGLGFALILLIASVKLKVEVDPKIEAIQAVLPGVDCGACGMAGCGSYAKAVAGDPMLLGKCAPGGGDVAEKIATILSLQVEGGSHPLRAVVHCNAHTGDKTFNGEYQGILSCTAANALPSVQACKFGCLGFGDCVQACKFDALHIIDGLATVDYDQCTGCTACSQACPRNLIEMVPFSHDSMTIVACKNQENGKTTRQMCTKGCIGCSMCKRQCDLFTITDFCADIDYGRYEPSESLETAIEKCPTKVIVPRGKGV